jgi:peptide/nickel transport system substrate-binding protein
VLVRNENYWGPRPSLDRLRFRTIQESLARLTDYTNSKSDMVRPTSDQFRSKVDEPGFTDTSYPLNWFNMQSGYSFIAWQCGPRNGKLLPFHDRRVRMAMTHLIDRERILRDINKGLGSVATSPFNPATEQADPEIKPWPFDVQKAKDLLAEAGWVDRNADGILDNEQGERFEFEFVFPTGSESTERMVTYVKDQCASLGIKCTPRPTDWSILQTLQNNRDFDAITFAWSASAPENDPNQIWHSTQIQNQGDNFIQWNCPEADALIEEGRRQTDYAERMKVWHRLHRVFHEEQPYTFMINIPWLRFVNKRVENVHTYPSGIEQREMFIRVGNQALLN